MQVLNVYISIHNFIRLLRWGKINNTHISSYYCKTYELRKTIFAMLITYLLLMNLEQIASTYYNNRHIGRNISFTERDINNASNVSSTKTDENEEKKSNSNYYKVCLCKK